MPSEAILRTADSVDFDQFDYKHYDQETLSLDEAIKKASQLRSKDSKNLYRVVPADRETTKFYVDAVPSDRVLSERWTKWMQSMLRHTLFDYLRRNG